MKPLMSRLLSLFISLRLLALTGHGRWNWRPVGGRNRYPQGDPGGMTWTYLEHRSVDLRIIGAMWKSCQVTPMIIVAFRISSLFASPTCILVIVMIMIIIAIIILVLILILILPVHRSVHRFSKNCWLTQIKSLNFGNTAVGEKLIKNSERQHQTAARLQKKRPQLPVPWRSDLRGRRVSPQKKNKKKCSPRFAAPKMKGDKDDQPSSWRRCAVKHGKRSFF